MGIVHQKQGLLCDKQLSDGVENIVRNGEIACDEQLLLFPKCFPKMSVVDASNRVPME